MNINLNELGNDFLSENPKLETLYKKENKLGIVGITIVIFSILAFTLNFIFSRNIFLVIVILIVTLLIFVFIDKFLHFPNFNEEFDKLKGKYLQKLLDSIANSSLKFISSK